MDSKPPLVSVVIPCYNAEHFIKETITSVLHQSLENIEVLLVNDGSSDGSESVVKAITDPRLRYFYRANAGVSRARNFGIEQAKGKYIAFLDADDLYLRDNLKEKIYYLEKNPHISLVHAIEVIFASESKEDLEQAVGRGGKVLKSLLSLSEKVVHSPSSVVVRKSVFEKIAMFNPELSTSADWDMWVRLAVISDFGFIQKPLTKYRVHAKQMHNNIDLMEKDMLYAFDYLNKKGVWESKKYYNYCLANLMLVLSACYYGDAKNYSKAVKYLAKSILVHPRPFLKRLLKG